MKEAAFLAPGPTQDESEPADLLGRGGQFVVYDLGNGRVKKVPQSIEDSAQAIAIWHHGDEQELKEYAANLARLREQGSAHVQRVLEAHPEAAAFFGNPVISDDGSIEQDKIETLGDALKANPERAEDYLWEYVRGIRQAWRYGFHEWTFNMTQNFGVDSSDKVVVMDFCEVSLDRATMHKAIDDKSLEHSYDYANVLTDTQQAFVRGAARALINHHEVDKLWGSVYPGHSKLE